MRTTMLVSVLSSTLLAACGSPPKPPTVDESTKRPANSAMAVELQVCTNDLQNERLLATEARRLATSTLAALANLSARQQALASMQAPSPPPPSGNSVYTVRFEFASSRIDLPAEAAKVLVNEAKDAPLVLVRGRTDGASEAIAESRMARDRANAVRDYLVAAGVEPSRIRATYQPVGDHVVDNDSPTGRSLNRRVEVEIYRVAPTAVAWRLLSE